MYSYILFCRVLTIKEKNYKVIKAYLKYIYTDTLEADLDLAVGKKSYQ